MAGFGFRFVKINVLERRYEPQSANEDIVGRPDRISSVNSGLASESSLETILYLHFPVN
jgi:hypothetical protein